MKRSGCGYIRLTTEVMVRITVVVRDYDRVTVRVTIIGVMIGVTVRITTCMPLL